MGLSETYSVDLCPTLCLLSQSIEINQHLRGSKSLTLNDPFLFVFVKSHSIDISHFGIEFLSPLPEQLLLLINFNTSHNGLSKITDNFFEYIQNLVEIDFSHNKLINLSKNSFDGSYKLRNVNVSYNRLLLLAANTFWDLRALKILDLSHNLITVIEEDLFANNAQLMEVHLNNNHIKSIHHHKADSREKRKLTNKPGSTSIMITVFVIVFGISAVITIFMKCKIIAQMRKMIVSNIKDTIMLLCNRSYMSTELNDSIRSYGIYRKFDEQC